MDVDLKERDPLGYAIQRARIAEAGTLYVLRQSFLQRLTMALENARLNHRHTMMISGVLSNVGNTGDVEEWSRYGSNWLTASKHLEDLLKHHQEAFDNMEQRIRSGKMELHELHAHNMIPSFDNLEAQLKQSEPPMPDMSRVRVILEARGGRETAAELHARTEHNVVPLQTEDRVAYRSSSSGPVPPPPGLPVGLSTPPGFFPSAYPEPQQNLAPRASHAPVASMHTQSSMDTAVPSVQPRGQPVSMPPRRVPTSDSTQSGSSASTVVHTGRVAMPNVSMGEGRDAAAAVASPNATSVAGSSTHSSAAAPTGASMIHTVHKRAVKAAPDLVTDTQEGFELVRAVLKEIQGKVAAGQAKPAVKLKALVLEVVHVIRTARATGRTINTAEDENVCHICFVTEMPDQECGTCKKSICAQCLKEITRKAYATDNSHGTGALCPHCREPWISKDEYPDLC